MTYARRAETYLPDGDAHLLERFVEAGMLYAANRLLHPFGWALGTALDDQGQPGAIVLVRTDDPAGIGYGPEEGAVRAKFLRGVGQASAPSPDVARLEERDRMVVAFARRQDWDGLRRYLGVEFLSERRARGGTDAILGDDDG